MQELWNIDNRTEFDQFCFSIVACIPEQFPLSFPRVFLCTLWSDNSNNVWEGGVLLSHRKLKAFTLDVTGRRVGVRLDEPPRKADHCLKPNLSSPVGSLQARSLPLSQGLSHRPMSTFTPSCLPSAPAGVIGIINNIFSHQNRIMPLGCHANNTELTVVKVAYWGKRWQVDIWLRAGKGRLFIVTRWSRQPEGPFVKTKYRAVTLAYCYPWIRRRVSFPTHTFASCLVICLSSFRR